MVSSEKMEVERHLQQFRKAAETYRVEMECKLKAKVEELKVLGAKKVEIEARVESLETKLVAAMAEKRELEAEVVAKKRESDLVKGENDKLQSEVVAAEKKHTVAVAEVESLRTELGTVLTAKEAAAKAFDAEKARLVGELEGLKRKLEETQADKEAAEGATREKDAQAGKLRAELEELHTSMSQLQASCNDLDMKRLRLHDEKNSVLKALDAEKAEAVKLSSKIEELEKCNGKKDGDIGKLKAALEEKKGKINTLSKDIELLQLAVAEAQKRRKGGIWTWLYAATTTMVAAISFIYATRSN